MQSNLAINVKRESGPRCVNSPDVPEVDDPQVFAGLPCGDLRAYSNGVKTTTPFGCRTENGVFDTVRLGVIAES